MTDESWRDRLRGLRVFGGELPAFAPDAVPENPLALFSEWLDLAIESGVSQPHAMAIATVGGEGAPSARTLLLKDLDADALWFATMSTSQKGRELAANPRAALLFYWREQGRQVRVTGDAEAGPRALSESDFLQRSPNARVVASAGNQSDVLPGLGEFDTAVAKSRRAIETDPEFVPEGWTAFRLRPVAIEFWQATRDRDQIRLRYTRQGEGWARELLWP
ncbi:pyridoxine/pyridoxamine 5'-phosphate oxidase [Lacisediminihabitans profunda]|uniref:Pyridoxamine 5'-phosphate oxidase n=1 Tax=Lacisediminihabitans profunda TaxID=2594790 RepID=A0A5C8ULA1_9MICO|nr:pyridoxal 5'-phosphate synthase [Lacisediminihabitans profunda]TXN28561.1 pyridoxamine 5'-phosphate oxidase [Lacisediminihabitans profunda]